MAKMTWLERRYRRSRLDYVRHITIDPRGPGVVRIHMIPPRTEDPADPFLLLLNGAQLVPLNLSWASCWPISWTSWSPGAAGRSESRTGSPCFRRR